MTDATQSEALLAVDGLCVHFPIKTGLFRQVTGSVRAVDGIDFRIRPGETFALVGESGCGKSTTGYAVLRMIRPTAGSVRFDGNELTRLEGEELRRVQGEMQIVFQDPYSSLDPKLSVGDSVGEPLLVRGVLKGAPLTRRVGELLALVGLRPEHAGRYPHEFSGGQRQRIGIARALALKPKLVVCDEPVSALDVSVRSQILNLLTDLKRELGVAYLFISHDLSVVRHVSDRVAVMYLGHIVEEAPVDHLFAAPSHPYTKALMSAIPLPDPVAQRARKPIVLQGDLPSPAHPPTGCPFRTRCPIAQPVCATDPPALIERTEGHRVACHFAG